MSLRAGPRPGRCGAGGACPGRAGRGHGLVPGPARRSCPARRRAGASAPRTCDPDRSTSSTTERTLATRSRTTMSSSSGALPPAPASASFGPRSGCSVSRSRVRSRSMSPKDGSSVSVFGLRRNGRSERERSGRRPGLPGRLTGESAATALQPGVAAAGSRMKRSSQISRSTCSGVASTVSSRTILPDSTTTIAS